MYSTLFFCFLEDHLECSHADTALPGLSTLSILLNLCL